MAMAHEIMFYGIAQKDSLGFDKAVEEAKARMARYQVTVSSGPRSPLFRTSIPVSRADVCLSVSRVRSPTCSWCRRRKVAASQTPPRTNALHTAQCCISGLT